MTYSIFYLIHHPFQSPSSLTSYTVEIRKQRNIFPEFTATETSSSKTYLVSEKPSLLHVKYLPQKSSSNPQKCIEPKTVYSSSVKCMENGLYEFSQHWPVPLMCLCSSWPSGAWASPPGHLTAALAVSGFTQGI